MNAMINEKYRGLRFRFRGATIFAFAITLIVYGCGDLPSPPPPLEMGAIEIHAKYDSSWNVNGVFYDSIFTAPFISYNIDNGLKAADSVTVPVMVDSLYPGVHNIQIAYRDYRTTVSDTVEPGLISISQPIMSLYLPDFFLPGIHYDPAEDDSLYHEDSVRLSDFHMDSTSQGEVVLLYYFGVT